MASPRLHGASFCRRLWGLAPSCRWGGTATPNPSHPPPPWVSKALWQGPSSFKLSVGADAAEFGLGREADRGGGVPLRGGEPVVRSGDFTGMRRLGLWRAQSVRRPNKTADKVTPFLLGFSLLNIC